ncbi:hypothetical protein [Agromyces humi]|uniref:hypothetical protein n=1 Tax=Agromyces humi TaxID=1766800 RepID=UPI0013577FEA|nr:hypothetical protein [Agromyces humi]
MHEPTHENLELTSRGLDIRFLMPSIAMGAAAFVSTIILFAAFANANPVTAWIGFVLYLVSSVGFVAALIYNGLQLKVIDQARAGQLADYIFERHGLDLSEDAAKAFLKRHEIATRLGTIRLVAHVDGGWVLTTGAGKTLTSGIDLTGAAAAAA